MMHAASFLAATSAMIGGLPAFPRGRRRLVRHPDPVAEAKAAAKRRRKAAKREEDARRSAEGRERARHIGIYLSPEMRSTERLGFWDNWQHEADAWGVDGIEPRWRARLNHRRSLRMEGHSWLGSDDQWRRLLRPRSFMTRAWRRVKRNQACAALWKELSR